MDNCPSKVLDILNKIKNEIDPSLAYNNIDRLTTKDTIDLLIIDGPPVKTNQLARYPALPLLFSKLSKECIIILDDAARPSEQQAGVSDHGTRERTLWKEVYPCVLLAC